MNYTMFFGADNKNGYLSNFYWCPFKVDRITYKTSEHYFMYQKAMYFEDYDIAKKILEVREPLDAKRLGRRVKNYNDDLWCMKRELVMEEAVYHKFSNNKRLLDKLLKAEGKFVEASPYDTVWGIGMSKYDKDVLDPAKWKGLNLLGKILDSVKVQLMK